MVDRELNVRLIEVNSNPALTEDSEVLKELIPRMMGTFGTMFRWGIWIDS